MRKCNFYFPTNNKAAVTITSALYDRRALDCTAPLALVNSLSHLHYLINTSTRIRELVSTDGGFNRLIRILKNTQVKTHNVMNVWKWSLAFNCLVAAGIRGTQEIRVQLVNVGIIKVLFDIMEAYLKTTAANTNDQHQNTAGRPERSVLTPPPPDVDEDQGTEVTMTLPASHAISHYVAPQNVMYRIEDAYHSMQLLGYLSKYPDIRRKMHEDYERDVFATVEQFTFRGHPHHIRQWAVVVMRNGCRKDESRDGLRQCANLGCLRFESYPREFAKCRRCRKAKYCGKACQSRAWVNGHRSWCTETQPS
ncbi:hypothetical protein BJ085DRAFT_4385, partial [Dimargaris cristalligena]